MTGNLPTFQTVDHCQANVSISFGVFALLKYIDNLHKPSLHFKTIHTVHFSMLSKYAFWLRYLKVKKKVPVHCDESCMNIPHSHSVETK